MRENACASAFFQTTRLFKNLFIHDFLFSILVHVSKMSDTCISTPTICITAYFYINTGDPYDEGQVQRWLTFFIIQGHRGLIK